jgi:hypothetical protein
MEPRRRQPVITIRSAKAHARLRQLTRTGRSQAAVIEEALERMADPKPSEAEVERRLAEIDRLIEAIPKGAGMSMKEFDAAEYDADGELR